MDSAKPKPTEGLQWLCATCLVAVVAAGVLGAPWWAIWAPAFLVFALVALAVFFAGCCDLFAKTLVEYAEKSSFAGANTDRLHRIEWLKGQGDLQVHPFRAANADKKDAAQ